MTLFVFLRFSICGRSVLHLGLTARGFSDCVFLFPFLLFPQSVACVSFPWCLLYLIDTEMGAIHGSCIVHINIISCSFFVFPLVFCPWFLPLPPFSPPLFGFFLSINKNFATGIDRRREGGEGQHKRGEGSGACKKPFPSLPMYHLSQNRRI